jgi:hypothetical protein
MRCAAKICLALTVLVSSPVFAERFSNPTIGISIDKPDDWYVLTAGANAENLKRAKLGSPEFQAAVQKYATVPLYAFIKYAEPYADLNPSIKINIRPAGKLAGQSGSEILAAIIGNFQNAMVDFKLISAPAEMALAGRSAGHAVMDYTLQSDGSLYPVRSEMWIIPQGENLLIVGVGYRQDEKTGGRDELMKIVGSIALDD